MGFPSIYWINLAHRTDRRAHFEAEMEKLKGVVPDLKVHRMEAVAMPRNGALGCGLSHVKALELFMTSEPDAQEVIIMEDDFTFIEANGADKCRKGVEKMLARKIPWDMVLLASNTKILEDTPQYYLTRIRKAFTTTAYLIKREYVPKLILNLREACAGLIRAGRPVHEFCIDTYWQRLQLEDIWYGLKPLVGYQYPNFSDIEYRYTDYRHLMTNA